jgi:3-hydroxybutyryl-CoA dehydrogenase
MNLTDIHKIAIAGAGTMGAGIAQVCAQAGFKTILFDLNADAVEKAKNIIAKNLQGAVDRNKLSPEAKEKVTSGIYFSNDFNDLKADVLIEAIIEKLEPKRELFTRLAAQNAENAILATNTSSIPVTQIAYGIPNPERVVGMHFFNPAHLMKLVEVISGAATAPEIAATIKALAEKIGKTAVMAADSPGFIVNRVARHYYVEALKILEEDVASFVSIDRLMESSGFRMGPFRLMDLIGVNTNFDVTTSIYNQFQQDAKFRPSRIQKQKVDAGYWGQKSGKGFYSY